jgi:hypothetical protein
MSLEAFKSRVGASPYGCPILVVDDIQLAQNLRTLMGAAKYYADKRLIKIVLVISSGEVARQMQQYSSKSRADVCRYTSTVNLWSFACTFMISLARIRTQHASHFDCFLPQSQFL